VSWIVFDGLKRLPGFTLRARWESSGNVVALLGRSGCGKTLTLRCIAGLERPDEGRIRVGERVLYDSEHKLDVPVHQRRVGFVFQHYALFPHLSVRRNILFGCAPRDGDPASGGSKEKKLREMLALCRLEGFETRYPRELSGGQRQRVAIARALASNPAVLLLDEPFAALDRDTRDQVLPEVRNIIQRARVPTVLVTHDVHEAEGLGEELIYMEDGAVVTAPRASSRATA
jgi:molybdate transport system ATP-binding protein